MSTFRLPGEIVQPMPVTASQSLPVGGLVSAGVTYPYTAVHHHEWEFIAEGPTVAPGGEWFPKISEARHVPGGNGTTIPLKGDPKLNRMNPAPMLAGIDSKRSVVIPLGDKRLGEYAWYLQKFPTSNGWLHYCYAWVEAVLINRGRQATFETDMARMLGFRRQCVAGGIIDPMPRQALTSELHAVEARIARWTDRAEGGQIANRQAILEQIAEARDLMQAMSAAWYRQFGDAGGTVADFGAALTPEDLGLVASPGDDSDPYAAAPSMPVRPSAPEPEAEPEPAPTPQPRRARAKVAA